MPKGIIYLKKLTAASMKLDTDQLEQIAENGAPEAVTVVRIYGQVTGEEAGTTQYGNYIKFSGSFEAVRGTDKQKFRSTSMIFPTEFGGQALSDVYNAALGDAQTEAEKAGQDPNDVKVAAAFGFDWTVEFNDARKGGTKFMWGYNPLMDAPEPKNDPLAKLGASFGDIGNALPAPKKGKKK